MLYRKITEIITEHLKSDSNKVLVIDGARQVGKTYIIRQTGKQLFKNFVEINLLDDFNGNRVFEQTRTVEDFYLQLGALGARLGKKDDTLVFLDEIQAYPYLLTMLKFLQQDGRFTYIASGSLLGVTLARTLSIPIGSIRRVRMYPLDFEEFLIANGVDGFVIDTLRQRFVDGQPLDEGTHTRIMKLFKNYLLTGGMPDAVNDFITNMNINNIRGIQSEIHEYYGLDAAKYDSENKMKIKTVYDFIPSALENKKKRIVVQDIENRKGRRFNDYCDEFEYLIQAGIALEVRAVSNPKFPLLESQKKNLLKLYLNDVGILTNLLYANNIRAILDDVKSINLGTVYESVVAQELHAHGHKLTYYDNKKNGEVDFLVDDYNSLSVLPIEVKSGKNYKEHSALSHFIQNADYGIQRAIVFSNERQTTVSNGISYLPIYYSMFV